MQMLGGRGGAGGGDYAPAQSQQNQSAAQPQAPQSAPQPAAATVDDSFDDDIPF